MDEKVTYYPYTRGIMLDEMRLGSLFLDPGNPNVGLETNRFIFKEDLPYEDYAREISGRVTEDPSNTPPFTVKFMSAAGWCSTANLLDMATIGGDSTKVHKTSITGRTGRRVYIKKPKLFLEELVLTQPRVGEWLAIPLSVTKYTRFSDSLRYQQRWKEPRIWMLTGIQIIEHAKVHYGWSIVNQIEAGATVDLGLAAGGIPTGQAAAGINARRENVLAAEMVYGHEGERVWCAQFMRLATAFVKPPISSEAQERAKLLKVNQGKYIKFRLLDVEGLELGHRRAARTPHEQQESENSKEKPLPKSDSEFAYITGLEEVSQKVSNAPEADVEPGDPADEPGHDTEEFIVDATPYAKEMDQVAWNKYDEYRDYLEHGYVE